jgi:predicted CopG family antitoxin
VSFAGSGHEADEGRRTKKEDRSMKTIQIDRDIYDYLASKATQPGEPPAAILRRELHMPPPAETIEIDDETYAFIVSKTESVGESASSILRRELNLGEAPHHEPNAVIEFHIPAGTGIQPWNTQATIVAGKVGDTLRIVNDDAVPHRLHTTQAPFPHPESEIMPGQSQDFLLREPYDSSVSGPLHDHATSRNAHFWIRVDR